MNKIKWTLLVVGVLIFSLIFYKKMVGEKQLQSLQTTSPKMRTIEKTAIVPGEVIPDKEIQIKPHISGVIESLFVKIGDHVKKGDKIAKIKVITDPITIEKLEKQYRVVLEEYNLSKINNDRNKLLFEDKVIAKSDVEESEKYYNITSYELNALRKELQFLKEGNASEYKGISDILLSPTDGTVLEAPVKVGSSVIARNSFNEGTTIAVLADLTSLIFQGKVSESDIKYLYPGKILNIAIAAINEKNTPAKLDVISPKGIEKDGIIKFDIFAPILIHKDFGEIIRAGYSANAHISLDKKENILSIEEKYLQFSQDSVFVEIEKKSGVFEKKLIKVGLSDGIYIEVIEGLSKESKLKIW